MTNSASKLIAILQNIIEDNNNQDIDIHFYNDNMYIDPPVNNNDDEDDDGEYIYNNVRGIHYVNTKTKDYLTSTINNIKDNNNSVWIAIE